MKSDEATICARKHRLLELLIEGKTQAEAAEILRCEGFPAHPRTIQRDVMSLKGQWKIKNMSLFELIKEKLA
jgi:hypothetical protein